MRVIRVDLDGGPCGIEAPTIHLTDWGPRIRIACRNGLFRRFQNELSARLNLTRARESAAIFYGSGDFHHVTLALLRRISQPFNLLILDLHPDWVRGVPFLHCGTWVAHALNLLNLRRIFHVGGDVDFDNHFRWYAPRKAIRSGKIVVIPARRTFSGYPWGSNSQRVLQPPGGRVTAEALRNTLAPWRDDLAHVPLYISVDKDVMEAADASVNWDSGYLNVGEVLLVLSAFREAASGVVGMDVLGDWSPVRTSNLMQKLFHRTEHPKLDVDANLAQRVNARTNQALVEWVLNDASSTCR